MTPEVAIMRTLLMLMSVILSFGLKAAEPARPKPTTTDDYIRRLQQAVVDLDASLRKDASQRDAEVNRRLGELERAMASLRPMASANKKLESRITLVEEAVTNLRQNQGSSDTRQLQEGILELRGTIAGLTRELAMLRASGGLTPRAPRPPYLCSMSFYGSAYATHYKLAPESKRFAAQSNSVDDAVNYICEQCVNYAGQRGQTYKRLRGWEIRCSGVSCSSVPDGVRVQAKVPSWCIIDESMSG